jgi:hypothetical protein
MHNEPNVRARVEPTRASPLEALWSLDNWVEQTCAFQESDLARGPLVDDGVPWTTVCRCARFTPPSTPE